MHCHCKGIRQYKVPVKTTGGGYELRGYADLHFLAGRGHTWLILVAQLIEQSNKFCQYINTSWQFREDHLQAVVERIEQQVRKQGVQVCHIVQVKRQDIWNVFFFSQYMKKHCIEVSVCGVYSHVKQWVVRSLEHYLELSLQSHKRRQELLRLVQ